ncbi:MAG: MATE family efflux transporter [Cyanobacteria bacterium SZAS TMP-1]|nr:MATE family efflux transporter [Cyanobacteria bacterium SZAS TMP-1]
MSWPLLLTTIGNSLVSLVDVKVASYLGSSAQAAVGLAEQILFVFLLFVMSVGVGTTALVSRAYGANDTEDMLASAGQSFTLSIMLGLILCALSLATASFALPFFTPSKEVAEIGSSYLTAYSWMLIPFSVTVIANSTFRAIGDSKTPLVIVTCMTVVNIIGDYATVLGNWPVPGLGVRGMAYAALAASILGSILATFFIKRSVVKDCLNHILPYQPKVIHRISSIGVPSAFQRLGWALSVFVVFFILARCKDATSALAAWTIGMRVESVIFMPLMALSMAVASIVGQNLGAHEVDRAFKAGWRVTSIGIWMMLAMATCMFVFAHEIASALSNDPNTIAYTTNYLKINSVAEPFLALAQILTGALQGAGDTKPVMWFTIICNWIIRLPFAYVTADMLKLGPDGVWWAMSISVIIQSIMVVWRYQGKKWIQLKV